jgi:hypothetical protein
MISPRTRLTVRKLNLCQHEICHSFWFRLAAVAMFATLLMARSQVQAISISFSYDEREKPSFDPNGTELRRVARAAADLWESYILDNRSFHFDLSWENLGGGRLGQHEDYLGFATNNILIDTKDTNGNFRNWFFDPTPFQNEEFGTMTATLARDMDPVAVDEGFAGQVPPMLEIGFHGFSFSGSAAHGKIDLFSILLHEMGHELGMNYSFNDDAYNFNPNTVGGRNLAVWEQGDYELNLDTVLMTDWPNLSSAFSERRLPSATDILATYNESITAVPDGQGSWKVIYFDNYNLPRVDFLGEESNNWNEKLNWIGGQIPDTDNEVFIRHGGLVLQTTGNNSAKALTVSDSSSLAVQGNRLVVIGDTTVGRNGTRGDINVGNIGGSFATLETDRLIINNGIVNAYNQQASVNVMHDLTINSSGTLMGAGVTRVGGTLINNGTLSGGTFLLFGFGGTQTVVTSAVGAKLDLDGNGSEQGEISATIGNLSLYGPITDAFNGRAGIAETRTMYFSREWVMNGQLNLHGGADASKYATLAGAQVTIGGTVNATGQSMITAPVILNDPAQVNLPAVQDTLVLAGATTLRGGTFTGNGTLAIAGATNVAMPNPLFPDERANESTLAMLKVADTAAIPDLNDLEMSPGTELLPGNVVIGNFTTYALNVPLQVRAGGVMTASVSSLYLPKTTTMSGGRITGTATVNQVGNVVVDGNSTINPNTFLWGVDAASHSTTIRAGKRLDLTPNRITRSNGAQEYHGNIVLETGATLNVNTGIADTWTLSGELVMGLNSTLMGDNLVNTGTVRGTGDINVARFENRGRLIPTRTFGGIEMPNAAFVQTTTGILEVAIGNPLLGFGTSVLDAGTAELDGILSLSLAGNFRPTPGTIFDILTADVISGQFNELDIHVPFGTTLSGSVLYQSNKVSFRVDQFSAPPITPSQLADFNGDGAVDRDDLQLWSEGYGQIASKRGELADADGNGQVDGRDMLIWQRQLGKSTESVPSRRLALTAVPEPGTMLLGMIAVIAACCFRGQE